LSDPSPSARSKELSGVALASSSALAFGTLAIFGKYAFAEGAETIPLLAGRFAIATGLIAGYQIARRKPLKPSRPKVRSLSLLGICYALESALFFFALERAPAGTVALIFYSFPLWTTLLSLLVGLERFRWGLVAALTLGTAGVSLIFTISTDDLSGPLFALGAAVTVAVYFILAQVIARDVAPAHSAMWTSAGAAAVATVIALATQQDLPASALVHTAALGVASATAFALLFGAIARIGSARASVAAMLEPVATVILAAIFLDEEITTRVAVGAALIVSALPVLASTGRRADIPAAADSL
jgi:drug/metabolite transporter (DMT)-like permease